MKINFEIESDYMLGCVGLLVVCTLLMALMLCVTRYNLAVLSAPKPAPVQAEAK